MGTKSKCMAKNIKQIIKEEYIKCAKDPVYFFKKYCYIQHPSRGKILFNLYDFQEDLMDAVSENRFNVILKSRQLGISTLSAGYSLWLMLFQEDKNVLVIATKQEVAKNLVTKVRFMHQNLPSWLRGNTEEDNKLSLRLKNGSQIKATSAAGDAGRSEALSLLVIDEAAFIDRIDEWNGQIRISDYKTGTVKKDKLKFLDFITINIINRWWCNSFINSKWCW